MVTCLSFFEKFKFLGIIGEGTVGWRPHLHHIVYYL